MRISDWSSDVCSSDLAVLADRAGGDAGRHLPAAQHAAALRGRHGGGLSARPDLRQAGALDVADLGDRVGHPVFRAALRAGAAADHPGGGQPDGHAPGAGSRSEEHTSELQSLMRISYAVFCLKKKKIEKQNIQSINTQTPPRD